MSRRTSDQARRDAQLRRERRRQWTRHGHIIAAAAFEQSGTRPRERARRVLAEAARTGEQLTDVDVATRARCGRRTVSRAKEAMRVTGLVKIHRPAPIRGEGGRVVGRDPGGCHYKLARRSRVARAVVAVANGRAPNAPHVARSTSVRPGKAPASHRTSAPTPTKGVGLLARE